MGYDSTISVSSIAFDVLSKGLKKMKIRFGCCVPPSLKRNIDANLKYVYIMDSSNKAAIDIATTYSMICGITLWSSINGCK